jgi:hypothetical protein
MPQQALAHTRCDLLVVEDLAGQEAELKLE